MDKFVIKQRKKKKDPHYVVQITAIHWKGTIINVINCLRYHGTPKLTMFSKNTLLSFSDKYYSNLSFTKSFRKKDCFYAKLWTKKDLWH